MQAAQRARQYETSSAPHCPFLIEYDLNTFHDIGQDVNHGFRAPLGSVEVGGFLLGTFDGERLRILDSEPIPCEYAFGPFFRLSDNDRRTLDERLGNFQKQADASGLAVVGWYRSRLGGQLAFSDEDLALHDRYFTEPWQVLLLECLEWDGSVQSGFMVRPEAAPASAPRVPPRTVQKKTVWAVLGGLLALCIMTAVYLHDHFSRKDVPATPRILRLEAARQGGQVEVSWDKQSIGDARTGQLEIRDGADRKRIVLDRNALVIGKFGYAQAYDVSTFRLIVERPDGTVLEGSTTFVAPPVPKLEPARVKPAPLPEVKPAQVAGEPPIGTAPVTGEFSFKGHWMLQAGHSHSPVAPQSVSITITETNGTIQGKLEAFYRSRTQTDRIHFSFFGKASGENAQCYWNSVEGGRGEIEFNRIPDSPDQVEVVWHKPNSERMFKERLQRAN